MLQDARIEVDHVGVGEWICNRPQDANMLYQDSAILNNASGGNWQEAQSVASISVDLRPTNTTAWSKIEYYV
jgi:hypothetical protein